ncbi:MAG: hypothetical protein ACYC1A_00900 [Spirochaetales bacterium]
MMLIVSVALFALAGLCLAQVPAASDVAVGGALHRVSLERLDKDSLLFLVKDSVVAPAKDISSFSIVATIAENRELKSLIVTVVGASLSSASGELEWLFPSGGQVNLYGKTASKPLKDGKTECTITILAGLTDLSDCSARIAGKNVLLKLYSKKGVMVEIELPSAFIQLLSDPAA